ncbi:MAG: DUF962 domain-containing protein [Chitinophagales bacterium]|nr:DUF962 domain-containing protein [Chitinophagales bacterium]
MSKLSEKLALYAETHTNPTNKKIHYVCVPLILLATYWILYSVSHVFNFPSWLNMANIVYFFALIYWFLLHEKLGMIFLTLGIGIMILSKILVYNLGANLLLYIGLGVFLISWIFQFYGHKIEGKKPSFLDDLQFLLVGPAWIVNKIFKLV